MFEEVLPDDSDNSVTGMPCDEEGTVLLGNSPAPLAPDGGRAPLLHLPRRLPPLCRPPIREGHIEGPDRFRQAAVRVVAGFDLLVHGDLNDIRLCLDGATNCLLNPPGGLGAELIAPVGVELPRCCQEAELAFLASSRPPPLEA